MPMVAAGAVLSGVVAGSTVAAIGFSWAAFAGSLILGGLSYALTPKPKRPDMTSPAPGTVAVKQSDLTRTRVYGHTRVVRGYAHMASTNSNQDLHLILILCEGGLTGLRAINEIWVNDYCIPNDWLDADGNVTQGRYAGFLQIRKHLGTPEQIADPLAVLNLPEWTDNHRLQGTAYIYAIMKKSQDVYPTGVPNLTAIVEAPTMYDPRIDAQRWSTNIQLMAYDFVTNQYGFDAADEDVNAVNAAAQANICDEIVPVVLENFNVASIDIATNIIKLSGNLLTLQFGDQVQIASDGTVPAGLAAATNYYVIPYQIKDAPRIRLATSLDNAMDKVAIDITSAGTGVITLTKVGEPRYHGGGEIDSQQELSKTLNDLATSMAGRVIQIAGSWTFLAGAYRAPATTLGIDDMRGSGISLKTCLSMGESYNIVKGLFNGPASLYQDTDYPAARYETFIAQDLGVEAIKDLRLPFTTRPTTAQRIAKIELFRARQDIAISSDFSLKAMLEQPGSTIAFDFAKFGLEGKEFEITNFTFDITDSGLSTKLSLRETAEAIYDWSAGEAIDYDAAPNTTLPNPYDVAVVGGFKYNSKFIETRDGDAVYTIQGEWDLHTDAFVREWGQLELQFKLSADSEWTPSFFVAGNLTTTDIVTASVGTMYDLAIRAQNHLGVRSEWTYILGAVVGSSGGVVVSDDWLLVTGAPTTFKDWGNVYDAPSSFEDWGFVV